MKEFKIAQFEDDSGDRLTVNSIVKSLKNNHSLNISLTQYSKAIEIRTAISNDVEFDLLIVDMYDDETGNLVGEDIIADNERNKKIPTIIFTQGTVKGNRTNFSALFDKYDSLINQLINKGEGDKLADMIFSIINGGVESLLTKSKDTNLKSEFKYPQIKYAIITALYNDEFEEVSKIFDFPEKEEIVIGDKTYYVGYLKSNPEIKVVAGIPFNTGMVDASIMATQMIEIFRPNYILMSGVCGGFIDDCNLGDIVIARNVYTFQKGKLSDIKTKDVEGNVVKIDLFDKNNIIVDYDKLYDKDGNQITISIESFKREEDSVITIDHFKDKFDKHKNDILDRINRKIKDDLPIKLKNPINLHYEPMACSTMVINKEGFFEDTLKSIDRKTIAVEMESYGVARACRYANAGKTKPVIFKSVMDFTYNKSDSDGSINWKKFAAYTSAQFMNYLFENKVI